MANGISEVTKKCSCVFYEPGLVSFKCESCRRRRTAQIVETPKDFYYGVSSEENQQAE